MLWSFEGSAHLLWVFRTFFFYFLFFLVPTPAGRCWEVLAVLLPAGLTLLLCKHSAGTSRGAAKAVPQLKGNGGLCRGGGQNGVGSGAC